MITNCRHCKKAYWRYRGDVPPSGYCSVECHAAKGTKRKVYHTRPQAILGELRQHLRDFHPGADILDWIDCELCEGLQARYAEALSWETSIAFYREENRKEERAGGKAALHR